MVVTGEVNQIAINELENLTSIEEVPDNKENDCSKCKQVQRIEERQKYLRSLCIGLCVLIIGLIIALVVVVYQPVKHGATTNLTLNSTPIPNRPEPTTPYPKSDLSVSSDLDPPVEQVNRDQNTGMIIGGSIGREEDIILRCVFPVKLNQRNLGGNVYWWHDGEEISPKHKLVTIRVDMEFGFSFFAKGNATVADTGKYTCQWLKDGVSDSASVYINVG